MTDGTADLWSVPAYLRRCATWLTTDEVRTLQRADAHRWTVSDLVRHLARADHCAEAFESPEVARGVDSPAKGRYFPDGT